ncbi:hypothetical protein [Halomicrobium katesii]|uniref:hypothetical protein n=1 Tax=Halomicrobium katesii TaxID=437163 RepID=UPI000375A142|nr:hypothetical protein [Halomicrobium katesii]
MVSLIDGILFTCLLLSPLIVFAVTRWWGAIPQWKLSLVAGSWLGVLAAVTNRVTGNEAPLSGLEGALVVAIVICSSLGAIALLCYSLRIRRNRPDATYSL